MKEYSDEERQYIRDNFYKFTEWEMVNNFNLTFNTNRSFDSIHAYKKRLRKKGLLGTKLNPITTTPPGYRGKSIIITHSSKGSWIRRVLRNIWERL